ncbi:hypothetical protein C0995_006339 [Termitomyces sp. Mi166|nr:hypothetical protein C0995_006339 [Termitomyces sp. Mi166\
MRFQPDYEQCSYVENLGVVQDEPHFYQAPEYSGGLGKEAAYRLLYMQDKLADEGCYEHPQQMRLYTSVVTQSVLPSRAEYVQYAHPVDEVLLQHLEWTGQPIPAKAAFLQDDLAVMVVEGLLDQIKLMRRQCITTLEQIECVGKHKAPAFEKLIVKPKQARALLQRPQKLEWAPARTVVQLLLQPMKLEQRSEAPQVPVASSSKAGASSQRGAWIVPKLSALCAQPAAAESHRLSVSVLAPNVPGPSKHRQGQKPQADISKMDVVNFPSNVPAQAGLEQLLFLHAMAIPAPPPQLTVVVVTTDPRTPEQYDGLIVTQQKAATASKGKGKVVLMLSDESDYDELSSMHKQELEKGESVAQCFQRVQYNKKLAAKKMRKAKAEAALQHKAINDFSGRISDRLGVKVWGLLNVEQLNSCFRGALSDCAYYSAHNNAIFIRANANWAATFEYSAHQRAKMLTSLVYKFAPHGFSRTLYELEWLYKHYANEHTPHHD